MTYALICVLVLLLGSWRPGTTLWRRNSFAKFVSDYIKWTHSRQASEAEGTVFIKTRSIMSVKITYIKKNTIHSFTHYCLFLHAFHLFIFYFSVAFDFQQFANAMRKLRRAGKIGEFVSIFVNEKQVSSFGSQFSIKVCLLCVLLSMFVFLAQISKHE